MYESTSTPPWDDESRASTDISGRGDFARAVADRIDQCADGQGSTVFGIVGPWGSGKTTLLREVTGHLPEWKCVWFSPWSVADVGSITAEFISTLTEAFSKSPDVTKKLASYARFGTPALKLIPIFGDAVATLADRAATELSKRPAWHTEFGELTEQIAMEHERVLVIVDDVDRLDGEELRTLLRVVRLLGRFKNVHYLLAYDQATIDRVLGSSGMDGENSEFMEKIVQYPFEVPPPPRIIRRHWSRKILDIAGPTAETESGEYEADYEELVNVLAAGLETPRSAERLRQQMLSMARLVAGAEVDFLDFTALTWLRIAHHSVWNHIRLNPDVYLSWPENESDDSGRSRMLQVESLVQRGHAKPVQDVVSFLFEPKSFMSTTEGRRWRMRQTRYFDRYFQVGLADDDVSERRTKDAIDELMRGDSSGTESADLRGIILGPDEERSILALEIAKNLRKRSSRTTHAFLDYLDIISTEIFALPHAHPTRLSMIDRMQAREIYLALKTSLIEVNQLIERCGYLVLVRSAYAAKRTHEHPDSEVKALFSPIGRRWVEEVRSAPLVATMSREELVPLTSFLVWLREQEDHAGFLKDQIVDSEALINVAISFVYYNEWVGSQVHYDVIFRTEEFLFAIQDVDHGPLMADVPEVSGEPDYDLSDRPRRDLTAEQRRDYAIRSLRSLDWD